MHQGSNPLAYREPITLDTLDALFAHHAAITGGWLMEGGGGGGGGGNEGDPPAFEAITSQEEFDKRLGARLAREREKFADYDDLVKIKEERDADLEAAKGEHEKALDAARKDGETAATQAANARLVKAEARALAAQAGFRSLSDVNLVDLSGVKVNADGEPDSDAIKAKLKALSDADPWRIDDGKKTGPQPDPSQGGGAGAAGGGGGGGGGTSKAEDARRYIERRFPQTAAKQ